jgi:hypothetical protein
MIIKIYYMTLNGNYVQFSSLRSQIDEKRTATTNKAKKEFNKFRSKSLEGDVSKDDIGCFSCEHYVSTTSLAHDSFLVPNPQVSLTRLL